MREYRRWAPYHTGARWGTRHKTTLAVSEQTGLHATLPRGERAPLPSRSLPVPRSPHHSRQAPGITKSSNRTTVTVTRTAGEAKQRSQARQGIAQSNPQGLGRERRGVQLLPGRVRAPFHTRPPCTQPLAPGLPGCLQRGAWSKGKGPSPGELLPAPALQLQVPTAVGCAQRGGDRGGDNSTNSLACVPGLTS